MKRLLHAPLEPICSRIPSFFTVAYKIIKINAELFCHFTSIRFIVTSLKTEFVTFTIIFESYRLALKCGCRYFNIKIRAFRSFLPDFHSNNQRLQYANLVMRTINYAEILGPAALCPEKAYRMETFEL
jgi:hypothetical protein